MTPSEIAVGMCHQCDTAILAPTKISTRPKPVAEVVQAVPPAREQEVRGPQPEDRERVRREHEEGFLADREDRGHRVDGEDHVGELDDDERGEQRRGRPLGVLAVKK